MDPKVELIVTYLHQFSPKKILTSYIISKLFGNNSISEEGLDQLLKNILTLRKNNFFHMLGGYHDNFSLIRLILNIIQEKSSSHHQYEFYLSLKSASQLDASFPVNDMHRNEYSHEATFLLMSVNRKPAKDFQNSCINFLRIFHPENEAIVIILAEQITHTLKNNKSLSKLSIFTIEEGETFDDLILSKDCDEYFSESWFSKNNSIFNAFLSQLEFKSDIVLDAKFEEKKLIMDESCVGEEESTKCMISDITNKSWHFSPGLPFSSSPKQSEIEILKRIEGRSQEKKEKSIYDTDLSFLRNFINKDFKLKILRGSISSKKSDLTYRSGYIRISSSEVQIENEVPISHQGVINFGRKGKEADIYLGDLDYTQISRNQFNIEVRNDRLRIQCCSPLPKIMTAFRIHEQPFFLKKDHIVTFGRNDECTFRILAISNKKNDEYVTFQKFSPKNNSFEEELHFRIPISNPIIGNFEPLNSPTLAKYKIKLDFDKSNYRWYIQEIQENEPSEIQSEFETFVYIFKFGDLVQKKSEFVELQEGAMINCGNCYIIVN